MPPRCFLEPAQRCQPRKQRAPGLADPDADASCSGFRESNGASKPSDDHLLADVLRSYRSLRGRRRSAVPCRGGTLARVRVQPELGSFGPPTALSGSAFDDWQCDGRWRWDGKAYSLNSGVLRNSFWFWVSVIPKKQRKLQLFFLLRV